MRLGATLAHLSDAPPYPVAGWARRLAGAGFAHLWAPEIIGRGRLVPDPFVALAVAAGATDGVGLSTGTVQVPLHHPVELAHRMLSLQAVCGDRLAFGISPGSTRADYAALGRDHRGRFRMFDENVVRLRDLLERGGDADARLADPPATRPPLLLGSWGANVEKAARGFDGWLASGYRTTPDEMVEALGRFRAAGGRRAVAYALPVPAGADLGRLRDDLERYADAGFDDAVVVIGSGGPDPDEVRALLP
ncbi:MULTISPECIES: LLM class flavin-dependent oxidoreductase [Pseudonocardia]|uniref:Alkanesulfonate monooxygenase SsuD/methylene tetrahydromethanopterin reductase-like flavin-dependent oxidoreductase (Luciferase family) n=1 Tax=Pseudonocardia alni TaxID=33907 RepID=A0AA44UPM8_PSEA5|nr:LLM class flavin-dependent oxidoreductase [Pseudonocardia alni]PKB31262.1 alkanesulfonate monooxygenase SsuD/methylene tetrahydromethanopterin reductase-like flavin-dependent oxidoreductase (luciferase family) [Pseudonocardia alni]